MQIVGRVEKVSAARRLWDFVARAAEQHPATAWTVGVLGLLIAAAAGVPAWPRPGWAGGPGGIPLRGGDALGIQAVLAFARPGQVLRWFWGPSIDGHSYRPLCMALYAAEFRLWGTHDDRYSWLSVALHLSNVLLLGVLAADLARTAGIRSLAVRLLLGLAAGVAFGAPLFADTNVLPWMIGYWPSQGDLAALGCSLGGLILYRRSLERDGRFERVSGLALLLAAALFKEIAYAALAAALLLSFHQSRRAWCAWVPVAAGAAALVTIRAVALHGRAGYEPTHDIYRFLRPALGAQRSALTLEANWDLVAAGAGLAAAAALRKRQSRPLYALAAGVFAAATVDAWAGSGGLLVDPIDHALRVVTACLILLTMLIAARDIRQPAVQVTVVAWLLACYAVSPFRTTFGWYRYWPAAWGALLQAIVLPGVVGALAWFAGWKWGRAGDYEALPCPEGTPMARRAVAWIAAALVAGIVTAAALVRDTARGVARREATLALPAIDAPSRVTTYRPGGSFVPRPGVLLLPDYGIAAPEWPPERVATGIARLGYVTLLSWSAPGTQAARPVSETGARRLIAWLRANAAATGVDPERIAVAGWGRSASIAVRLGIEEGGAVRAERAGHSSHVACVAAFWSSLASGERALPPAARSVPRELPTPPASFFLAYGRDDPPCLAAQYAALAKRLGEHRAEVMLYSPQRDGVFPRERQYWKGSLDLAIEFLAQHLPPPAVP